MALRDEHDQNHKVILNAGLMTPSVVTYALDRLADLGIGHVFGVPGDYSFPINDAVEVHPRLSWVPSANELNAAYAVEKGSTGLAFKASDRFCSLCQIL